MATHRIFSGIQPTGELHLGNYLGAIRNWVQLQADASYDRVLCCVVDYHALTVDVESGTLRERSLEMAASLLACGIDPDKAILFRQSDVPEHTELAWIFSTCAALGDLSRMTQFKDKSDQHKDNINAGLFTYPILQAADIALYRADRVPVGEDQVQHLELTREIVRRFERRFGAYLPEPQPLLSKVPRLRGLDGQAKMSKSKGNTISVGEDPKSMEKKLRGAVTDPQRVRRNDPGNPEVCNIFTLHQNFTPPPRVAEIDRDCRTAAIGCVDCKLDLLQRMVEHFTPIRERQRELRARPDDVADTLEQGRRKAAAIAGETMDEVRVLAGLRTRS